MQSRIGRKQASPVVLIGLCGCAAAIFQAACAATILAAALSRLSGAIAPAHASRALLGFARAGGLGAALQLLGETPWAGAGRRARSRLRRAALRGLLLDGPQALRRTHSGALASILVDRIEAVDGFFARYLPAASLAVAAPALVLVAAWFAQPFAALVLLCCGLAVPIMQALFGIGAAIAARHQFQAMSRLQARFVDRVRGIATIVLAGRVQDEVRQLGAGADELRLRTMRVLRVAFLSSAGLDCAVAVALVAISVRDGAVFLHPGHAPVPLAHALFALLLVPEFFAPLRSFALSYQDRAQASSCAEAVADWTEPKIAASQAAETTAAETTTAERAEPALAQASITFEDVVFTWDKSRGAALDGLSFHVDAGETVLLVGPSGSGKSTVIEMLLGFIKPESGAVLIGDVELQSMSPAARSRLITWIGQKPVLFAGTLRDNILFARPDAGASALAEALRIASLDTLVAELPQGLDTQIGEAGYGLSGGQAQRVAIARAVLRQAPLLLLDEPTAHLDPATEAAILESLRLLATGRTVLMASHSAAAQTLGGRTLAISGGRVAAGGALPCPAELPQTAQDVARTAQGVA